MGIRMKKLLPSLPWSNGRGSILLFLTLALAFLFVACGDDDSSSFVEPEKESSSSEILSSGDGTSDGNGDKSSSSVSSSSTNSSSSAKSSSSTDAKSSSSSDDLFLFSSSSFSKELMCFVECTEDCEGVTYHHKDGFQMICRSGQWLNLDSMENANTSSSSYFDMTEQFNEKVSYGEFTDPRDEQKYRTVDIYDKVYDITYTILAKNLNYGEKILGGAAQGNGTKYCYDDDPWYCENGWGGLYTWSNAMGFPAVCDSFSVASEKCPNKFDLSNKNENFDGDVLFLQHQGICPEGWHVMNEDIWTLLSEMSRRDVAYYMGSKVAGFGNENLYGMSLLPTGYWERYPNGTTVFQNIKEQTLFWLPEQNSDYPDEAKLTNVMDNQTSRGGARKKNDYAHSVRCVKNY